MQMLSQLSYRPGRLMVAQPDEPVLVSAGAPELAPHYDGAVRIDLNADVGEGLDAVDAALLSLVTSANICCGAHAGDAETMARTVGLALQHGVAIGAHPGYPDREGFGRREMPMTPDQLAGEMERQLTDLADVVQRAGGVIRHVKPHGALYNRAATDLALARILAGAVRRFSSDLVLVGLADSRLLEAGRAAGLATAAEGFADRAYEPDGSLRPRSRPGALHADAGAVAAQAVSIARDGRVRLEDGAWLPVRADTLCLHSDSPGAVANARAVRRALRDAGVEVAALQRGRRHAVG